MHHRIPRLVPLAGLVYLGLEVAGNGSIGKFPEADTPIPKLLPFYAAHHSSIAAGGALLHYAALALAAFLAVVWVRVRQSGASPLLPAAVLVGAAIAVAGVFDEAGVYSMLGFIGGKQPVIAPAALQSWHVNGAGGELITGDGGLMILLLAVAAAGNALPRWLRLPALVIGLVQLTPIGFQAELAFWVWAALTGIYLTIRVDPATASAERPAASSLDGVTA